MPGYAIFRDMKTLPGHYLILCFVSLCLLLPTVSALAESTVTCHCYRDREFSAQQPAAADPYLLATVQNRLMAYLFDVPRREIVQTKMAGLTNDRFWVAAWIASGSDKPFTGILKIREKMSSWGDVVATSVYDPGQLGKPFTDLLSTGADEAVLAWTVVEQVLETRLGLTPEQVALLRKSGATTSEAVLSVAISLCKEQSILQPFQSAQDGGSWGALLVDTGDTVDTLEKAMVQQIQKVSASFASISE